MNKKQNNIKLQTPRPNEAVLLSCWLNFERKLSQEIFGDESKETDISKWFLFVRRFFLYPGLFLIRFCDDIFNSFIVFKLRQFLFDGYILLIKFEFLLLQCHYLFTKLRILISKFIFCLLEPFVFFGEFLIFIINHNNFDD